MMDVAVMIDCDKIILSQHRETSCLKPLAYSMPQKDTVMPVPITLVCYNHKDLREIQEVVSELIVHGAELWWDRNGVGPGDGWRQKFEQVVTNSARSIIALVFAGSNGIGTEQNKEFDYLIQNQSKIPIVPVLLKGGNIDAFNKIGIAGINICDLGADEPKTTLRHLIVKCCGFHEGTDIVSLMKQVAILQPIEFRPYSVFLSASNIASGGVWNEVREKLTRAEFSVFEDEDKHPDAFTLASRETISSMSVVVVDGRLLNTSNLHPDAAYALATARSYGKPIILIKDPDQELNDSCSIFRTIDCGDEITFADAKSVVQAVVDAHSQMCNPYVAAGGKHALAVTFGDISRFPQLRLEVVELIESFNIYWTALEKISQGLTTLRGSIEIATYTSGSLEIAEIQNRLERLLAEIFYRQFSEQLESNFNAIDVDRKKRHELKAKCITAVQRIQGILGREPTHIAKNTIDFLEHFLDRMHSLYNCHQHSLSEIDAMQSNEKSWQAGPVWWKNHVSSELELVTEARDYLSQFFHLLFKLLKPQQPRIDDHVQKDNSLDGRTHTAEIRKPQGQGYSSSE